MSQRILIVGPVSPLFSQLVSLYLERGVQVAVAVDPDSGFEFPKLEESRSGEEEETASGSAGVVIPWKSRSPLSAKSVILECLNRQGGFDSVIVLYSPDRVSLPFHESTSSFIEEKVDAVVKGYMFLLKEILGHFQKCGSGTLSLVMHDEGAEILSPLDACLAGSFKSLAQSLFIFYQNEPLSLLGFRSSSTQYAEFAQFILRTMEDRSGKASGQWFKYNEKAGLFQGLPLGIRKK